MKKEAVNTFNDGLNYDLNPITTPDSILTDCVNGTFITFNGDEMALQNDAGNTKIFIPTLNKYVKLSDGFYPLGIKELGGVLYIISGNQETNEVELGSYPSPLVMNESRDNVLNIGVMKLNTEYGLGLYPYQGGVAVKFNSNFNSDIFNYLSYYDQNADKQEMLYDLKLYQKLNTGLIDITDWFNKKCAEINKYSKNIWLNSNNFLYCPNNYKGTLITKLELVKLQQFELYRSIQNGSQPDYYDSDYDNNDYDTSIGVNFIINAKGTNKLLVKGANIVMVSSNGTTITKNELTVAGVVNIKFDIGISNPDDTFDYTIKPLLSYIDDNGIEQEILESEIPDYIKNYTITGKLTPVL